MVTIKKSGKYTSYIYKSLIYDNKWFILRENGFEFEAIINKNNTLKSETVLRQYEKSFFNKQLKQIALQLK